MCWNSSSFFVSTANILLILTEVKHFNRNESLLTMTTNDVLPVSRLQKDKLIEQYGWL